MSKSEDYEGPAVNIIDEIEGMFEKAWGLDWERIRRACERAIAVDEKCFPAYIYLGHYEHDRRNYDRMEEHFMKALELAEDPFNAYTWDGAVLVLDDAMKDYERLARYLHTFYAKRPEFFVLKYLVNNLLKKLRRPEEALAYVNDYLQKHPNDRKALKLQKKVMRAR